MKNFLHHLEKIQEEILDMDLGYRTRISQETVEGLINSLERLDLKRSPLHRDLKWNESDGPSMDPEDRKKVLSFLRKPTKEGLVVLKDVCCRYLPATV